jgi:hypothetical protein
MPLGTPASLLFHRIAASRPDPAGLEWLRATADGITGGDLEPAGAAFVSAGRRLGRGALAAGEPLPGSSDPVPTEGWTVDDAARVLVLLAAGDPGLIQTLYREGDSREKRAVVRALPLLDAGERFLELALDAGRTNESDLFAALACDNPYPARHYGEREWNKLVMKAAFVGAPLARIVGLDRRGNRELCRMALDYIDQQESAARAVPPDLDRLVAPFGDVDLADRTARDELRRRMEKEP